jgi:RND family efflux transporter MFP subunit
VAELQTLRDQVAAPGTAVPAASADFTVYATEPCTIAELPKVEGDAVAIGDVLVRFEVPAISQDIAARQTALLEANQRVLDAQAEADKYRPLFEKGLVARVDYESRQASLLAAQSALVQAKTQLDLAQSQQERTVVRARFPGIVAGRWHQVGDAVTPGTTDPVIRVIDPTQLQFAAQVGISEFDRIRSGQPASVLLAGASTPEPATVVFTPRPMDPAAITAEIRVALRPGTTTALNATARVEVLMDERPNALVVPAQALKREPSGTYVMVVGDDGKASRREVRVGLVAQQVAQIMSGLMPGDRVITTALDLITDGTPVRVTK